MAWRSTGIRGTTDGSTSGNHARNDESKTPGIEMTCDWLLSDEHTPDTLRCSPQKTSHPRSLGSSLPRKNIPALQMPRLFFLVPIRTGHLLKFQLQRLFKVALFPHFDCKQMAALLSSQPFSPKRAEQAINRLREKQTYTNSLLWGSLHIFKGRNDMQKPKALSWMQCLVPWKPSVCHWAAPEMLPFLRLSAPPKLSARLHLQCTLLSLVACTI